jgi:uncharacterized protein (TIGR00369 family)
MSVNSQTDPAFEEVVLRVNQSFAKQGAMGLIGAQLALVEPGAVDITMAMQASLSQQHGFLHAGILTTALDSACGYAAATVMPAGSGVLTIEFKVNLLAPGKANATEKFLFCGRVAKSGRTIVFTEGQAFIVGDLGAKPKRIATMSATCMVITDRTNVKG